MSKDEWEAGTIQLPTAEVAKVKAAVRAAVNEYHDAVLAECKAWWAKNKTTSTKLYDERLYGRGHLSETAQYVLEQLRQHPRQVQVKDLAKFAPKASGNRFPLGEATISFNGRAVRWEVPENNHACDRAHGHPVAGTLFSALNRVKWTRGSGGEIVGNDEYNQDSRDGGGGSNYVVVRFGPTPTRSSR